jgi:hypothetical protein
LILNFSINLKLSPTFLTLEWRILRSRLIKVEQIEMRLAWFLRNTEMTLSLQQMKGLTLELSLNLVDLRLMSLNLLTIKIWRGYLKLAQRRLKLILVTLMRWYPFKKRSRRFFSLSKMM